jgi:alcohol dehydrogenase, propanol-preferring
VLRDVPVPDPGPRQVLLRVAAAGACHSDLHIMEFAAGFVP